MGCDDTKIVTHPITNIQQRKTAFKQRLINM